MEISKKILLIIILFGFNSALFSQGVPLLGSQKIPDDPPGEWTATRRAFMDGNRIKMLYFNNGKISDRFGQNIWPKGSGINMLDGGTPNIASAFGVDADGVPLPQGTIPDTLAGQDSIFITQSRMDTPADPSGKFGWTFYPALGYFNPDQDKPAISNDPNSWPIGGWPDQPLYVDDKGVTEWNGFFGRGKFNAELETYFAINDAWDVGQQSPNGEPPYFLPRPDRDLPLNNYKWGGLGTRIGTRMFQWAHPAVQDVIFFIYDIGNISEYDYDNITLGMYLDSGIGDDVSPMDDLNDFDKQLDLSWIYDADGLAGGGSAVGVMAFAYLESPGLPFDGIDNDNDGIIDESRDTTAGHWTTDPLEGPNGTTIDEAKWKAFYAPREPGPHWTGDENQNWKAWEDFDGDGVYSAQFDEINDDVGGDGVGANDLNYLRPDEDGTEANGKPDFGEPNFAKTDKDESDQIGLTTFHAYPRSQRFNAPFFYGPRHDKEYYYYMTNNEFDGVFLDGSANVGLLFSSGKISIKKYGVERFSLATLYTNDRPQNDSKNVPELFELKKTVQRIYNASYRFVKPPIKPRLTAVPQDGQITLFWDSNAEKSREPFYDYIEDFEGYKLIKSTEPFFEDARVVTNSFGNKTNFLPIAQWDLKDGIKGHADWSPTNGVSYRLGTDSGLEHTYVDRDVKNGRTYFYALVAYDFGMESDGVAPSENTATITLDRRDSVVFIDRNCVMVTPRTYASGFQLAEVDSGWVSKRGSGTINVTTIAPFDVKNNNKYSVTFDVTKTGYDPEKAKEKYRLSDDKIFSYKAKNYYILNITDTSNIDTLEQLKAKFEKDTDFPIIDGMQIKMNNIFRAGLKDFKWDSPSHKTRINVFHATDASNHDNIDQVPWDYTLHFVTDSVYTTPFAKFYGEWNALPEYKINIFALNHNFFHKEFNGTDSILVPDTAAVILVDVNKDGIFQIIPSDANSDFIAIGEFNTRARIAWGSFFNVDGVTAAYDITFRDKPQVGQVLEINTKRPFFETDKYVYSVAEQETLNKDLAKAGLEDIKVVPNPYVATNLNELFVRKGLHQRRRLSFTHLPAKCTLTIYNASGFLVDRIDIDNPADNGLFQWDMQTSEGLEISYGVYVYHVTAQGIGDKVGKFAVIK